MYSDITLLTPKTAYALKFGDYIQIEDRPYKITKLTKNQNGKQGHKKVFMEIEEVLQNHELGNRVDYAIMGYETVYVYP